MTETNQEGERLSIGSVLSQSLAVLMRDLLAGALGPSTAVVFLVAVIDWLVQVLTTLYAGVVSAVGYFELRRIKEGVAVGDVAAVFD